VGGGIVVLWDCCAMGCGDCCAVGCGIVVLWAVGLLCCGAAVLWAVRLLFCGTAVLWAVGLCCGMWGCCAVGCGFVVLWAVGCDAHRYCCTIPQCPVHDAGNPQSLRGREPLSALIKLIRAKGERQGAVMACHSRMRNARLTSPAI